LGLESNYAVKQIMQLCDMHLSGVHCIKLSVLLASRRRFMLMFVLVIWQHCYCRLFC